VGIHTVCADVALPLCHVSTTNGIIDIVFLNPVAAAPQGHQYRQQYDDERRKASRRISKRV
jgi:hypothetical protein